MTQNEIANLVNEIDNVDFQEFWWGSNLLERASQVRDARVVASLARRHQCLSNKKAISAHIIRITIKAIDGPEFNLLWNMIDSENDTQRLVQKLEDPLYLPWAAAYVLGEVGGATALREATLRLLPQHKARHYLIVRVAAHLIVRYLTIQEEGIVTVTTTDLKTGQTNPQDPVLAESRAYKIERSRREQANECFAPIDSEVVNKLEIRLNDIPDELLNMNRQVFANAIKKLPMRRSSDV